MSGTRVDEAQGRAFYPGSTWRHEGGGELAGGDPVYGSAVVVEAVDTSIKADVGNTGLRGDR